jgi:hypothetical protein
VVVFVRFGGVDFVAILRLFLTRRRVQFAAETKCARYLGNVGRQTERIAEQAERGGDYRK